VEHAAGTFFADAMAHIHGRRTVTADADRPRERRLESSPENLRHTGREGSAPIAMIAISSVYG